MTPPLQPEAHAGPKSLGLALRLRLASGDWSLPLHKLHHLAGYATLHGEGDDYFLGWLRLGVADVPVFDLNRVLCEEPTPLHFGSRILILQTALPQTPFIGLLAAGVTDTVAQNDQAVPPLDTASFLPLLYPLIPAAPGGAA